MKNRVIHKQKVWGELNAPLEAANKIPIPFKIIHFGKQGDGYYVWYEIDENQFHGYASDGFTPQGNFTSVSFACVGSGTDWRNPLDDEEYQHLTSIVEGAYVWHVYVDRVEYGQ